MPAEAGAAASEQLDAFEHVVGDHRLEHIQLEVALAGGQLHSGVVAHHLHGHHGQALGLGGIHLARHDRAARFVFRNHQLAQAAAGATGQPADVVGDFHQAAGQHREGAVGCGQGFMAGQGLKFVGRACEGQT